MNYSGPQTGPDDLIGFCICGYNRGAHRPIEAYHGEERLEGRKSTTTAKAVLRCEGYQESFLTWGEAVNLRHCSQQWYAVQNLPGRKYA